MDLATIKKEFDEPDNLKTVTSDLDILRKSINHEPEKEGDYDSDRKTEDDEIKRLSKGINDYSNDSSTKLTKLENDAKLSITESNFHKSGA